MKIIWSPFASTKVKQILEYISEDNPDSALSLIEHFETNIEHLKQNPQAGRLIPEMKNDCIREVVVHKNYGVIYEIRSGTIEILTVRHYRQNFTSTDKPKSS